MPLTVTDDHSTLRTWLGAMLVTDPVRYTVLGTVRDALGDGAWGVTDGDGSLAARSAAAFPLAVAGPWPTAPRAELRAALRSLPGLREIGGPPEVIGDIATALPGERRTVEMALFRLDELRTPVGIPGHASVAGPAERPLLRGWFAGFLADVFEEPRPGDTMLDSALDRGHCWLWRDGAGRAVSMALRRPLFEGSARIGPVYTPPDQRGHGFGSAVTAAASRDILDDGGVPVLFTDLANPTSNKIYAALGYYRIDDRMLITFT